MKYFEAMETTVTKKEALKEIRKHGLRIKDFLKEVGNKEHYKGSEVLDWLGY